MLILLILGIKFRSCLYVEEEEDMGKMIISQFNGK